MSTAEIDATVPGGRPLVALRLIQYAALFAANVIVSRALGPTERAQYALPLALMALVYVIFNLSIDQASGRALGRRTASLGELVGVAATVSVGLGLAGASVCMTVGTLSADELLAHASTTAVALAAGTLPLALAAMSFGGLLLRTGRLTAYGGVSVTSGLAQLAGVLLLDLGPGLTPERALAVVLASTAVMAVGNVWFALHQARQRRARVSFPGQEVFARVLRDGLILQGGSIGLFLMFRIDLLLVAALTNDKQAGLYSLSTSLGEIVFIGASTLAQTGLHRITEDPPDAAARFTAVFARRIVTFGVLGATVVAACAYPGIRLLYGSAWTDSVLPLAVLALAAVAITLVLPVQAYLVREGRLRDISLIAVGSLMANIVLNVALIPAIGIIGAALASLITYWALALLLRRRFTLERRATGAGAPPRAPSDRTSSPVRPGAGR